MKVKLAQSGLQNDEEQPPKKKKRIQKSEKEDDGPSVFRKRKVAFRFSYDGTKYNGLQRSPVPAGKVTIEDVVFDAMLRTKIVDDIGTAEYIAGGRTDKERFNQKITAKLSIYTTTHGSLFSKRV